MHCPFCQALETKVINSRLVNEGSQVRRRRECIDCTERFTTYETAELVMPKIIKRDGRRKPFDEEKLRGGVLRALERRPVSTEAFETAIDRIKKQLRASGEREVSSAAIGEWVMQELRHLDEVAYIRFASVYLCFEVAEEFSQEVTRIKEKNYD